MKRREFLKSAGVGSRRLDGRRRTGDRAVDAGHQMAHADKLAEVARYDLRRLPKYFARRSPRRPTASSRFSRSPPAKSCPGLQVVDAVQNGTVEIGHTASYYYFGKDPTFTFGTSVPFGPNARLNQGWFTLGGGKDVLNEFYKKYNSWLCWPATPAARWAAGSARRSTPSTISRA